MEMHERVTVFSYRWRVVYIFSEDLEYEILRRFIMLDVRF